MPHNSRRRACAWDATLSAVGMRVLRVCFHHRAQPGAECGRWPLETVHGKRVRSCVRCVCVARVCRVLNVLCIVNVAYVVCCVRVRCA